MSVGLKRGFARHCPECGQGRLFQGYLKVEAHCPVCGSDNGRFPADDAPPYFTILIVGHIIVPAALWLAQHSDLSTAAHLSIWLPLTLVMTLGLLPFIKGGVIGASWAMAVQN